MEHVDVLSRLNHSKPLSYKLDPVLDSFSIDPDCLCCELVSDKLCCVVSAVNEGNFIFQIQLTQKRDASKTEGPMEALILENGFGFREDKECYVKLLYVASDMEDNIVRLVLEKI